MRRRKAPDDIPIGFQIAPMIDVVFVIMLFFMVMAGDVKVEHLLKTTLPGKTESFNAENIPDEQSITIQDNGQVQLNEEDMDSPTNPAMPNLTAQMMRLKQNSEASKSLMIVTVTAKEKARYARVIDVMNALSRAHITNVTFGVASED